MGSFDREISIFDASTSCSYTYFIGTDKYYGNVSNVNEELYFSLREEFDYSASNEIEHVDEKILNLRTFKEPLMKGRNVITTIVLNNLMITSMMWLTLKINLQVIFLMIVKIIFPNNFPLNDDFMEATMEISIVASM